MLHIYIYISHLKLSSQSEDKILFLVISILVITALICIRAINNSYSAKFMHGNIYIYIERDRARERGRLINPNPLS